MLHTSFPHQVCIEMIVALWWWWWWWWNLCALRLYCNLARLGMQWLLEKAECRLVFRTRAERGTYITRASNITLSYLLSSMYNTYVPYGERSIICILQPAATSHCDWVPHSSVHFHPAITRSVVRLDLQFLVSRSSNIGFEDCASNFSSHENLKYANILNCSSQIFLSPYVNTYSVFCHPFPAPASLQIVRRGNLRRKSREGFIINRQHR